MLRLLRFCASLLWLAAGSSFAAQAQALDPTFQPTELRNAAAGLAGTLAVQQDGKVVVAGGFDFVGSSRVGRVSRLEPGGSPDLTFNPGGTGANGPVWEVLLQSNGKILIAGAFSAYNGVAAPAVARLNTDGTPDPTFTAQGLGMLRSVYALALQADGKILAGGLGQVANGAAPDVVVRLNADGTRDPTFALPTQLQLCSYCRPIVYALLVQPSGKIVVGGSFAGFSNPFSTGPVSNIIRLNADGSPDTSFNPNAGAQGFNERYVSCLAQQPDGKLLVGGYFHRYGLTTTTPVTGCLMRLDPNGALDPSFAASNLGPGQYASISTILPLPSGRLLVGGSFAQVGGVARGGVAQILNTGALDVGFLANSNGAVGALAITASGQPVLGGSFTQYDGVARNGVVRVFGNGALDPAFVPPVFAVRGTLGQAVPLNNGQLLVSGNFTAMNGTLAPSGSGPTLRVNANGSLDATFSSPNTGYLCGAFANGNYHLTTSGFSNGSATLSRHSATGTAPGFTPQVYWRVLAIGGVTEQPDGKLLVYGNRPYVMGGNSGPTFYRFCSGGAVDASFTATGSVETVFLQPDGKLITFSNNYYRRLEANGALDNSFAGGGPSSNLDTLTGKVMQPNGQMLISGSFGQLNGVPVPFGIVRLLPTGALDPAFSGVSARYTVKAVQPDGRILVTSGRGVNTTLLRLETDGRRDLSFSPVAVPLEIPNTYLSVALTAQRWQDYSVRRLSPRGWAAPRRPGPAEQHRAGHSSSLPSYSSSERLSQSSPRPPDSPTPGRSNWRHHRSTLRREWAVGAALEVGRVAVDSSTGCSRPSNWPLPVARGGWLASLPSQSDIRSVGVISPSSGNLDTKNAQELHQIFFLLRKELGQTFVIVTHNEQLAEMADRKIMMRDGHILEGG